MISAEKRIGWTVSATVMAGAMAAGWIGSSRTTASAEEKTTLGAADGLKLSARVYRDAGRALITVDAREVADPPERTTVVAELLARTKAAPVLRESASLVPGYPTELVLNLQPVAVGDYTVRATAVAPDGAVAARGHAELHWPGKAKAFENINVLNNVVWELVNVEATPEAALPDRYTFTLPYDRWLFVCSVADSGTVRLCLDDAAVEQALTVHAGDRATTLEAMRYVRAGHHRLRIICQGTGRLRSLVLRAIPALHHGHYHSQPSLSNWGPYDWDFLEKYILPQCNVMSSNYRGSAPPELEAWKRRGRKWVTYTGRDSQAEDSVEAIVAHYTSALGMSHPLMDGVQVDEFYKPDSPDYTLFCRALDRMYADPKSAGKGFSIYLAGHLGKSEAGRAFVETCIQHGGRLCWEGYMSEMPDLPGFWKAMRWIQSHHLGNLKREFPGALPHTVWVLASFSSPWQLAAGYPHIDHRVNLDMQLQVVATHPEFFGLAGLEMWHSGYSSDELLRFIGRAYRHYGIDGSTDRLLDDPLILPHVRNPNFTAGTAGWTVVPAEPNSVQPREREGFAKLQGCYYRGDDTFLWTKRSAARPNVFSQEIRQLDPGRLYSMKLFTGDYQDLTAEVSAKKRHTVSITLDNVELLQGRKKSFQVLIATRKRDGEFSRSNPFWWNYHWRVFRARAATAHLTVSDWKSLTGPGGPIGQELIHNFIEVQPYMPD